MKPSKLCMKEHQTIKLNNFCTFLHNFCTLFLTSHVWVYLHFMLFATEPFKVFDTFEFLSQQSYIMCLPNFLSWTLQGKTDQGSKASNHINFLLNHLLLLNPQTAPSWFDNCQITVCFSADHIKSADSSLSFSLFHFSF